MGFSYRSVCVCVCVCPCTVCSGKKKKKKRKKQRVNVDAVDTIKGARNVLVHARVLGLAHARTTKPIRRTAAAPTASLVPFATRIESVCHDDKWTPGEREEAVWRVDSWEHGRWMKNRDSTRRANRSGCARCIIHRPLENYRSSWNGSVRESQRACASMH